MAQRAPCEPKKRTLVVLSWCNVIWVALSIYHLVGFTSELLTSASASFELWYLYCRTASTVFLSLLLKLVLLQVAVARLAAVESALKIELFKFPLSKRNSVNQIVHIDWIIKKWTAMQQQQTWECSVEWVASGHWECQNCNK